MTLDISTPAWAYGSVQDDGSRRGRIDLSAGRDKIPAVECVNAPGGEGSHHAIDPADPNIVYSHGFYGNFTRSNVAPPPPDAAPAPPQRGRGGRGTRRRHADPAASGRRRAARAVDGADHHVRARAGRDLRGIPVRLSFGQSRRVVGTDQPGPDVERSVAHAAAQQQRDPVPDDHGAGRVAAPARPALCGHRRRQAARDARTTARPGPS